MLKRGENSARVTYTPRAPFTELQRARYLPPSNPSSIMTTIQTSGEVVTMGDGTKKFLTPARHLYPGLAGSSRRTTSREITVRFPPTIDNSVFQRWLQELIDRGKMLAIYQPGLDQPEGTVISHRDFLEELWTENGTYYYTQAWPWDERSIRLYDQDGTLIYAYTGSSNTPVQYPYMITIEPEYGRISTNVSPPGGVVYASYHKLIVGSVTEVQYAPIAGREIAAFTPSITLEETKWPATDKVFRLHLTKTEADVSGLSPITASTQVGHPFIITPVVYKLEKAVPGYGTIDWSIPDASEMDGCYIFISSFVTDPLVDQILPSNLSCALSLILDSDSKVAGTPAAFIYLWRPGVGFVCCLHNTKENRNVVLGDITSNLAGGGTKFAPTIVHGTENIEIHDGDRIVVEAWVKHDYLSAGTTIFSYFGGTVNANYLPGTVVNPAQYTWWVEFSSPIYLRKA